MRSIWKRDRDSGISNIRLYSPPATKKLVSNISPNPAELFVSHCSSGQVGSLRNAPRTGVVDAAISLESSNISGWPASSLWLAAGLHGSHVGECIVPDGAYHANEHVYERAVFSLCRLVFAPLAPLSPLCYSLSLLHDCEWFGLLLSWSFNVIRCGSAGKLGTTLESDSDVFLVRQISPGYFVFHSMAPGCFLKYLMQNEYSGYAKISAKNTNTFKYRYLETGLDHYLSVEYISSYKRIG